MQRFDFISDLANPRSLASLLGPVLQINKTILHAEGFSGSVLERVTVTLGSGEIQNLILKHIVLKNDWLSQRSGDDIGREGALLEEPYLSRVWDSVHCPYIAFAKEKNELALLMNDVSPWLFPDTREPIDAKNEEYILNVLTSLHSSFWEYPGLKKSGWLVKPYQYLEVFGPGEHPTDLFAPPHDKIRGSLQRGWEVALNLLPGDIRSIVLMQAQELFEPWKDLPVTLLHGDAKLGNMAILSPQKVVIFDWAYVGWGPCGIELGWYLAVNSTRLARSKEELIIAYRRLLELHLKFSIPENTWLRMIDLAIITGTMMLLWNKALAYQSGTQRGKEEWEWWIQKLKNWLKSISSCKNLVLKCFCYKR